MSTFLRATVMLLVLVGGPITWMILGPLPEDAQQIVQQLFSTAKNKIGLATVPTLRLHESVDSKSNDDGMSQHPNPRIQIDSALQVPMSELAVEKIRSLGIDSFKLEAWGKDRKLFRFCCNVPIGHSHDLTRQFEEVNENPEIAIQDVIQEIVSWRQGRFVLH